MNWVLPNKTCYPVLKQFIKPWSDLIEISHGFLGSAHFLIFFVCLNKFRKKLCYRCSLSNTKPLTGRLELIGKRLLYLEALRYKPDFLLVLRGRFCLRVWFSFRHIQSPHFFALCLSTRAMISLTTPIDTKKIPNFANIILVFE